MVMRKVLGCVLGIFYALTSQAQTGVWVVEKKGQQMMLVGVTSFVPASGFAWPESYMQALSEAQLVVFETEFNTDTLKAADLVDKTFEALKLPDNKTLSSVVKPAYWQQLQAYASKYIAEVEPYNAVVATEVLLAYDRYQRGFTVDSSFEFYQLAKLQSKKIQALETVEQKYEALIETGKSDPNTVIELLLYQLNESREALENEIIAAYIGNKAFFKQWPNNLSEPARTFYLQTIDHKNKRWVASIENLLQTSKLRLLVMLDMKYLAGGNDSVLDTLSAKGYKVFPFKMQ